MKKSTYLAIDIGGTKTLLAVFDNKGKVTEQIKFPTPQSYNDFIVELTTNVANLSTDNFQACCVAVPGTINRQAGVILSCGNLGWKNESIKADVEKIINAPVIIENDAKLAGLSEAINAISDFKRVVYVTISTGIGIAVINDGVIDENIGDRGGKGMLLEHRGKLIPWEDFASGKAIVKKYGKLASEINDPDIWKLLSRYFAQGFIDLIAVLEPDVVIVGGGVGSHFKKYEKFLMAELKKYETPMMKIPPIKQAKHPEEAVVYGCYELIKQHYGTTT